MTISKSACDFRTVDTTGANGPFTVAYGTSTFVGFNVGAAPLNLVPGQTYWINVRNYSPDLGGLSCAGSTCNGSITHELAEVTNRGRIAPGRKRNGRPRAPVVIAQSGSC